MTIVDRRNVIVGIWNECSFLLGRIELQISSIYIQSSYRMLKWPIIILEFLDIFNLVLTSTTVKVEDTLKYNFY